MLISALLVKNEADRYLTRVLTRCLEFSDRVLVLDDRSTDRSAEIAKDLGCTVKGRSILAGDAWGKEAPARAELWDLAAKEASDGWVLICDADMLFHGNPRDLINTWEVSAWAVVLWDCWDSETQARVDGPWGHGPVTPRPWLFRPSECVREKPQWSTRGLHCGHAPSNLAGVVGVAPPPEYYWRHLAYVKQEDRVRKHAAYLANTPLLTEFERRHAASIAD